MNEKRKKNATYDVFLGLGAIWLIVGLLIYKTETIWPLGFIFLLIGFIGKFGKKK